LSISDSRIAHRRRPQSGTTLPKSRRGGVVASAAALPLLVSCSAGAVDVEATAPPHAVAGQCRDLIAALPQKVAGQDRREVQPSDALADAWGNPAIVLRCGVPEPPSFSATSQCFAVDGVPWFATDDDGRPLSDTGPISGDVVFTTIGRSADVEVVVPDKWTPQADALVDVADAVKTATTRLHGCE
jgi:hypothetical protein